MDATSLPVEFDPGPPSEKLTCGGATTSSGQKQLDTGAGAGVLFLNRLDGDITRIHNVLVCLHYRPVAYTSITCVFIREY